MPSPEELFRRLGPQGVRQLNDLFQRGGYSDEEKEKYIQDMSEGIYAKEGRQNLPYTPQGATPSDIQRPLQEVPGISGLKDIETAAGSRGPLPSSTPSYAPYGPTGGAAPEAAPDEMKRSPRATGPQQEPPNRWAMGLMTLGAGLQGGGGRGGNPAVAFIEAQQRRQEAERHQEQDFLNRVDILKEENRLRRLGETEKGRAKIAAEMEERRVADVSYGEAIDHPDRTPEERKALTMLRTLAKGVGTPEAIKAFNAASPELKFIEATGPNGEKTVQTVQPRSGRRGEAFVISPPLEQRTTQGPEGSLIVTPQRAPGSVPLEDYQSSQAQTLMVPEGAKAQQLGSQAMVTFQPKPEKPISSATLDSVTRELYGDNGQTRFNDLNQQQAARVNQVIEARQNRRAAEGATKLSIGEKADQKWASTRVADLGPSDTVVNRKDLRSAPFDAKLPDLPSSEWHMVRGEANNKKLGAVREAANIANTLERAAAKMSDAPGANWGQAFQTYASEFAGQLGPLSDLNAMQGLQMAAMRIIAESGSQISDMDMKRFDRLWPKVGDGGPVVRNKIGIWRDFAESAKAAVLGGGIVDVPRFLESAEEKIKKTPLKYNRATNRME